MIAVVFLFLFGVVLRTLLGNYVKMNNVIPGAGAGYSKQIAGAPVNGTDDVQTITVTATAGATKLSVDGYRTASLAFGANAAAIQTALRALPNVGASGAGVTGTGPFVVTFAGKMGRRNVPLIVLVESTLTGGTWSIVHTTPGVSASFRNEIKGTQLNDVTNGIAYINTGTPPQQTWTKVGTQT